MNMKCLAEYCPGKLVKALEDPTFRKCTRCELGCNPFFYNDTSPGKLQYQNCTTKCALTYESPRGEDFLACAMTHNCITFQPINVTCPKPEPAPSTSLADLSGEWWQHMGYNHLWDAYPCQHIHEMKLVNDSAWCAQTVAPSGPVKAPCWSYTYSYDIYNETGTKYFKQTWQLPGDISPGKPVDIYYDYMGSMHNETWYLLQSTDRYVVLVDCSYMSGWTNVGSILWVRPNITLTSLEMGEIATVYKSKTGWIFPDEFVYDTHGPGNCKEPY